jgi:hypothetical protein
MAQTVDRTKPPETPPIPAFMMPPIRESKLPNGLSVVMIEDQRFPLVSVRLSFQAGSKYDPKDLPGLSGMVAELSTQGTKTRSYRDIAEQLAAIGANLSGHASSDVLTLAGSSTCSPMSRSTPIYRRMKCNSGSRIANRRCWLSDRSRRSWRTRSSTSWCMATIPTGTLRRRWKRSTAWTRSR